MNAERLEQANRLNDEIQSLKINIKNAEYTQAENVVQRESFMKFNGIKDEVTIPAELFKIVGKLVILECQHKLNELEKQYEQL